MGAALVLLVGFCFSFRVGGVLMICWFGYCLLSVWVFLIGRFGLD